MESDPIIFRTLTPEEKNSVPSHVLQKIQIEIRNLHNIHQTAMATFKRKINETESKLINNNGQLELLQKKINQNEIEKHVQKVEIEILKSKNQSLQRENNFLKKITKKKESDFIKKNYEDKKKEIEKVLNEVINKDNQLNLRVEEYEKINKRLTNKINDQKKQLTYLLESSEDTNQQKQNLIRMIQTLSKENDRLQNEIEKRKDDVNEGNGKGDVKTYSEKKSNINNYDNIDNPTLTNTPSFTDTPSFVDNDHLMEEITILSNEKNNLYDQFVDLYSLKINLENENVKKNHEIQNLNQEIQNLINKQRNLDQVVDKYNEVSNELIRSNGLVRDYRLKIIDLTKKLEESEERYSTYILSNRTDIVALLGRELGYLYKKIGLCINDFSEISNFYEEFKNEQDRLTEMYKTKCEIYKNKCEELEGHSIKLSKFENQQIIINTMVQIPNEIGSILYELNHNLNDFVTNMIMLCDQYENIGSDYKNFIFIMKNDLKEKESIIKSLIENNLNSNNIDSLIKHENNMLKNEIILLKSKLDNFQSEEYTDVIEKLDQIRTENENIREYVTNLNSEILKKDHCIRNLEDNLQEITQKSRETREKLETKEILIVKYEKIIEKLRKIKDAYVKLKEKNQNGDIKSKEIVTTKDNEDQEVNSTDRLVDINDHVVDNNTNDQTDNDKSPSFKYLDTPPIKEKIVIQDEKSLKNKKRSLPLLSTENFVISENHTEKNSEKKM